MLFFLRFWMAWGRITVQCTVFLSFIWEEQRNPVFYDPKISDICQKRFQMFNIVSEGNSAAWECVSVHESLCPCAFSLGSRWFIFTLNACDTLWRWPLLGWEDVECLSSAARAGPRSECLSPPSFPLASLTLMCEASQAGSRSRLPGVCHADFNRARSDMCAFD